MRHRPLMLALLLALLPGGAPPLRAELLTSAITVQGVLAANGVPADGVYDLRLTPYADLAGSVPLAPAQEADNVLVIAGAFTVRVDFGRTLYQGDRLFLEIAVRAGNATGPYEVLAPRQELTAVPYALKPAAGSVTDLELVPGAVGSNQLAEAAVVSSRIAAGAVTAPKLAPAAVGSAAIADGAVVRPKLAAAAVDASVLADGAVTTAKIGPDAVTGAHVADGSLGAVDLAPGTLPPVGWRLDGNPTSPGQFLGTTNGQPLELRSDVGVTINGARFNDSTELTIRGSPAAAETNADIGLWPRASTAFFNLAAVGSNPASASLQIAAVGTDPFTGYRSRLILDHGGALGVGSADPRPQATLHAIRADIGVDAADLADAVELVVEDSDAQAALLSNAVGASGSALTFGEMSGGGFANGWGLWRATGGVTNVPLHVSYGASSSAPSNASRLILHADGSLYLGAAMPATAPSTSFVFNDDSAPGALSPSAPAQFLVRASGGVGINRTPSGSNVELSIAPGTSGGAVDAVLGAPDNTEVNANLWMGTPATARAFRISVAGTPSGNAVLSVFNRNGASADTPIMQFYTSGSTFSRQLGLFRGLANGSWLLPAHPIHVGDASISSSGNGAHLTAGGVWTNGSSRSFKRDFVSIDGERILDGLLKLPLARWRYRSEEAHVSHIGPMAEDFYAAFAVGADPRYIGTVDADGIAMAAIQGLHARLARENAALRAQIAALTRRLEALEGGPADD